MSEGREFRGWWGVGVVRVCVGGRGGVGRGRVGQGEVGVRG